MARLDGGDDRVRTFGGAHINASIQSVDGAAGKVVLYAPVFTGVDYHFAKPVADYGARFRERLAGYRTDGVSFSCNCILNFLFGELDTVYARLRRVNQTIQGEDQVLLIASHQSGLNGVIDGNRFLDLAPDSPPLGDALFAQALNQTDDLEQAFKLAKATVAERELADNFEASEPQIWAPKTVLAHWQLLRKQQARKALQSAALNDGATNSN